MGIPETNPFYRAASEMEQPPSYNNAIPSYNSAVPSYNSAMPSYGNQFTSDEKQPFPNESKHLPPPSYDYRPSSSQNPFQQQAPVPRPSAPSRFPPEFNVYMHFSTFTLGRHKEEQLFTVRSTGLRKPLALVQGADKYKDPLSTLKMKGMGGTSIMTIFPHEGGEISEPLVITIENKTTYHAFCITLPNSAPRFFEWRGSKHKGWNLIWLRSRNEYGAADEVVAACKLNTSLSMNKGLIFGFVGSGLDGSLGDTFQIAAVTTACSDFEVFMTTHVAIASSSTSAVMSAVGAAI